MYMATPPTVVIMVDANTNCCQLSTAGSCAAAESAAAAMQGSAPMTLPNNPQTVHILINILALFCTRIPTDLRLEDTL